MTERERGRTLLFVSVFGGLEDCGRQRRKQENPAFCSFLGVGLGRAVTSGNVSVTASPDPMHHSSWG